jgi:hypothetical protein
VFNENLAIEVGWEVPLALAAWKMKVWLYQEPCRKTVQLN